MFTSPLRGLGFESHLFPVYAEFACASRGFLPGFDFIHLLAMGVPETPELNH